MTDDRQTTSEETSDQEPRRQGDSALPNPPVSLAPGRLGSLLAVDLSCALDTEGHCITCADEARSARVLGVDQEAGLALVAVEGATEQIDISLVEGVARGDLLLVHGGVALERLGAEQ